ncbi:hexose transporter [Aspergillus ellipticus CBS 707.79]|uniref:Hexose transporter n=1 Tax=Aspergillus ellipticus CBS 707.79 TaxID=1448320 RepID=A0A319CZK5_9EURO|nr:hexose transporter [Aspergillus ellipticus CBS 707.79]
MDKDGKLLCFLLSFLATFTSATQGYDASMMNGLQILPSYTNYFHLTTATTSLNVAVVFLGSVVAMAFAGWWSDRWGRKWGVALTSLLAMAGAAIQAAAVHEAMFCIGRLIVGMSITTGATAAPAYISETAHPRHRVMLTSICGAAWYVGSVMAAAITYGTQYLDTTWSWRCPSLLQFLPSLLCILPLPFLPESPRWLVYQDRYEEARNILVKYHAAGDASSPDVNLEFEEIQEALRYERSVQKTEFKALVSTAANRRRFLIVILVAVFCQISGNNIITYYFGNVLTSAGITNVQTQLAINIGLSIYNLACAIFGSFYLDRFGRRPSFLYSTVGMAILLTAVAVTTPTAGGSAGQIVLIFLFYGCYSLVWTPLSYLYPIEVLSYSLRANGLAAHNGICHLAAFFNTYIIPYAMDWSSWGFYLITAIWCLVEVVAMWFVFPETKNMTLEEISGVFDGEAPVAGKPDDTE